MTDLVKHGIRTTEADYWVHFFPRAASIYWYRVAHFLRYFDRLSVYEHNGRSQDGTVTGKGILCPKDTYFVQSADVPERFLKHYDWDQTTDREYGLWGQLVVEALIEQRIVTFPIFHCSATNKKRDQFASIDCKGQWMKPLTIEIKTERYENSANLFVQTEEGGHKVHLVRDTNGIVERVTSAPEFSNDIPF